MPVSVLKQITDGTSVILPVTFRTSNSYSPLRLTQQTVWQVYCYLCCRDLIWDRQGSLSGATVHSDYATWAYRNRSGRPGSCRTNNLTKWLCIRLQTSSVENTNGTPIVPILDHCRTFQSYRIRQSHIALKPGKGNMLCIFSICPYVHRMTGCCVLYVWAYVQGSQKFRDAGRPLFWDSEIEIVQNRFETRPHLSCHAEFGRIDQTVYERT